MLFWASALTLTSGGEAQMSVELTSRPRLPPSRVITKRSSGSSGRSVNWVSDAALARGPDRALDDDADRPGVEVGDQVGELAAGVERR